MINFIGELPDLNAFLEMPGLHFHSYGKAPRSGRKVGHATLRADDPAVLEAELAKWLPLVVMG
jgi:5-(carboxyamino)imidazole ribonucleotide synthase